MKNVMFLVESLNGGGAEKVLTDIVRNIDKTKYNVTVASIVDVGVYGKDVKKYCSYFSFLKNPKELNGIDRIIYKIKYKLIYSLPLNFVYKLFIKDLYDIEIGFLEGFSTKLIANSNNTKSKKIAWVHTDMMKNPYSDMYYKSVEQQAYIYNQYNNIVCVSKTAAKSFMDKFSVDENKVVVQYNPVDSKQIIQKSGKDKIDDIVNDKIKLCAVGRLVREKGFDRLLKIIKRLKDENIECELWIVGDGEQKEEFEKYIYENELKNNIKLLGFKKNPYKYMKRCDVFASSSRVEGYCLVIAEAMILGKPIISTDCTGPNELLEFGEYGLLVKNDEMDLYEGIKKLILDDKLRKYYSEKSKVRARYFDICNIMNEIEGILGNE